MNRSSNHSIVRPFLIGLVLTYAAVGNSPAWAALPISQQPLVLPNQVKPAFIMSLDNSGSMGSDETLCRTLQGECAWHVANRTFFDAAGNMLLSGAAGTRSYTRVMRNQGAPIPDMYGAARDPEFNRAYFDPASVYSPWQQFDGSFDANSPIAAAPEDARHPATATDGAAGVTINFTASTNVTYNYVSGDVLSAGTTYTNNLSCNTPGFGAPTGALRTLVADFTFNANCTTTFKFYPATVYLTPLAPVPPGFTVANRLTIKRAGPAFTDLYKYEIIPANFANPADYTTAVQNFANYWTFYGDRIRAVVAGTTQALSGVDFMRVGSFLISPATLGAADPKVTMFDLGDYTVGGTRSQLYARLRSLDRPGNNTPTRRAVYRLGEQFRRIKSVADPNPPILLSCQVNGGMLFTDGYINDDNGGLPAVGNVDGVMGSPYADAIPNTMADIAAWSYVNNLRPDLQAGRVPVASGCPNQKFDCQTNLHMNFYGIPLGARGAVYDNYNHIPPINVLNPNYLSTTDPFANPPPWSAKGLCNGCGGTTDLSPPAVDDLWHAALNTRGKFISAQSPAAVRDGIRSVLNAILDAVLPAGTNPVLGVRLGVGSFAYGTSFAVGNGGHDWTGTLFANQVNANGSTGALLWDAATKLNAIPVGSRTSSRTVVVVTTPGPTASVSAQLLTAAALGGSRAAQINTIGLTVPGFDALYGAATTTTNVVDYLKGEPALEQGQPGGVFRKRSSILGDIIGSIPEVEGSKDDFGYNQFQGNADATLNAEGAAYPAYLLSKATRSPNTVAFVGANDGMLHAFNGTAAGGNELFAFMPNSIVGKLGALLNPDYIHQYYVDGQNTVADAYFAGSWKSVLVGSTGAGGTGVYALNVTSPNTFSAGSVMWELNASNSNDLGASIGRPGIIQGEDKQFYAVFGNGFNSVNSNPVLFLVNLSTGVATTLTGNDGGNFDNGIGQIAAVDVDGDGLADTVYGGDFRGNLWKFDLTSNVPGSWNVANSGNPLFVAKDSLNNLQPITGGFEIARGPLGGLMIYFGTGKYFLVGDNSPGATPPIQTFYGVWDGGAVAAGTTLDRSNLVQQTINNETTTTDPGPPITTFTTRDTSANPVAYNSTTVNPHGFFMDLKVVSGTAKGESFLGTPKILNGTIFFRTFEPQGDACNPGGVRWDYALGALSGVNAFTGFHASSLMGATVGGSNTGAVQSGTGSPGYDPAVVITPSKCVPGRDAGCPTPVKGCDPITDPTCILTDTSAPCTFVNRDTTPVTVHLRSCGRQSWRQLR